jgi:hypothetical protein
MLYEAGSQITLGAPDDVHHVPRLIRWGFALDEVDRAKVMALWGTVAEEVKHQRDLEKVKMTGWEQNAVAELPEM